MLFIILTLIFIDTILLFLILAKILFKEKPTERIQQYFEERKEKNKLITDRKTAIGIRRGFAAASSGFFQIFAFKGLRERIERSLIRADIAFKAEELLLIIFASIIAAVSLVYLASRSMLVSLFCAVVLCLGYYSSIDSRIKKRRHKMNEQLADALDMIAGSLRTGFSFMKAIEVAANDMGEPISKEFRRVIKEADVGLTIDQALKNLMDRMASDDLELMVTAVIIQRQVGGNLAEVLDNISETIRSRIALKREIKVLAAPGKVSGIIVALLPILLAIILYIMDPKYIGSLFTNRLGIIMLAVAFFNECIGFFIIKHMVEIQY